MKFLLFSQCTPSNTEHGWISKLIKQDIGKPVSSQKVEPQVEPFVPSAKIPERRKKEGNVSPEALLPLPALLLPHLSSLLDASQDESGLELVSMEEFYSYWAETGACLSCE